MLQDFYGQTPFPSHLRTPGPRLHTPHHKASSDPEGLIYGTTVQVPKVMALIQRFILEFQLTHHVDDEYVSEQIYRIKLNDLPEDQSIMFEVEGKHLRQFDRELYLQFIYFPAEMISIFDQVLRKLFGRYFVEPETNDVDRTRKETKQATIMTGIKGLHEDDIVCVRELGPQNIGKLVMLRAIAIRISEIYPQMKRAWFKCENCSDEIAVPLLNAKVQEPEVCRVCFSKETMQIMHNFSSFTDKQYIKIQELPELVTEGQSASSLTVISYDANVDGVRPGDRVELIGIYRAQPFKSDRYKGTFHTVFNTYLDLISFNLLSENRYSMESKAVFTDSEKQNFLRFAEDQKVVQKLVSSFAPSIYGHDDVKTGILAQLFGGHKKILPNRGATRADINVCLVGDPSTAKSQLLQQVHRIAPRCVYTSGRGSSAVGLTASVRKDPQSGQFVLESGALVLADQGICCIDEFDKMQQNSRTILLQAMQQQTISIAKAGIVCQLNSRTAILAAANPINSKYNAKLSVVENINLPPSILSRFDLIYILLDLANEVFDKRLAEHILDFYVKRQHKIQQAQPFTVRQLTRYITYARNYVFPVLSMAAGEKLKKEYISLRGRGIFTKTITATPRQLESLIRLSQAYARMRLSNVANQEDVQKAVLLLHNATLSSATNAQSGILDIDIITTGRSSLATKRLHEIAHKMREFLLANQQKYRKQNLADRFFEDFRSFESNRKAEVTYEEFLQGMKLLQSDELLVTYGPNKNNQHFKLQVSNDQ